MSQENVEISAISERSRRGRRTRPRQHDGGSDGTGAGERLSGSRMAWWSCSTTEEGVGRSRCRIAASSEPPPGSRSWPEEGINGARRSSTARARHWHMQLLPSKATAQLTVLWLWRRSDPRSSNRGRHAGGTRRHGVRRAGSLSVDQETHRGSPSEAWSPIRGKADVTAMGD
jgi:hypothetical protein